MGPPLAADLQTLAALAPVLALPALAAAPDPGQIFKCTDGSGNVTYQNEPCPKNVKAGKVDIFENSWTSDRVEKEAEWRRNAIEHRAGIRRQRVAAPSDVTIGPHQHQLALIEPRVLAAHDRHQPGP